MIAQEIARDHHAVDFGRAFADPLDAQLAVPALQRQLVGDAEAAEDLHAAVDDAPGRLRRIELADRRFRLDVVAEIAATRVTERGETRADDRVSEAAMEDRKIQGYF